MMDDWTAAIECLNELRGCVPGIIACYERKENHCYFGDVANDWLLKAIELHMDDRWPESARVLIAIGPLIGGVRAHVPDLVRLMAAERLPGKLRNLDDLAERMDDAFQVAIDAVERDRQQHATKSHSAPNAATVAETPEIIKGVRMLAKGKRRRADEVNIKAEINRLRTSPEFEADRETYRTDPKKRSLLRDRKYSELRVANFLGIDKRNLEGNAELAILLADLTGGIK